MAIELFFFVRGAATHRETEAFFFFIFKDHGPSIINMNIFISMKVKDINVFYVKDIPGEGQIFIFFKLEKGHSNISINIFT